MLNSTFTPSITVTHSGVRTLTTISHSRLIFTAISLILRLLTGRRGRDSRESISKNLTIQLIKLIIPHVISRRGSRLSRGRLSICRTNIRGRVPGIPRRAIAIPRQMTRLSTPAAFATDRTLREHMTNFTTQVTCHRLPPVPRFAIETPNYQIAGDMFIKKNVNKAGACLNIWQTNPMLPFNSLNSAKTHQHLLNMTVKRLRRIMVHLHRYKTPLRKNFTRATTQRNLIMSQQVLLGCGIPESNSSNPPRKNLNSGSPKIFIVFTMDELSNSLPGVRLHKTRNIHREGAHKIPRPHDKREKTRKRKKKKVKP